MLRQKMLRRKMRRDIVRHKTQFISIFLMAFLAVFIYTGVGGEWRGLEKSIESFYSDTNLADIFLVGESFTEEDVKAVNEIKGVTGIERRTSVDAGLNHLDGQTENESAVLTLLFTEKNEISKTYLIDGEDFDVEDTEGIWLSKRFADANDLTLGDSLTMSLMGENIEKEIKGIVYSSEQVYKEESEGMAPDFKGSGYAYISHKAFPVPEMFVFSEMLITAKNSEVMEAKIEDTLNGSFSMCYEKADLPSVSVFRNEILQHKMMGDVFPIVFLLVALLTIMSTMTRIVRSQRTQIGTLRALGFKRTTILTHYVSYGFVLSLIGGILGCVVGPLTLPRLFYPSMSGFYTVPEWKPAFHISYILIIILVVVACTLVTYIACSKYVKETPADTLRPKAPRLSKHSFFERTWIWKKLRFNAQWNFRDARRSKVRSIMAIVGVLGCTALLSCAFGMNDSMKIIRDWQYEDIYKFESKATLSESITDEQLKHIVDDVGGETIMEAGIEIRTSTEEKTGLATITDDVSLISPTDYHRNSIDLPSNKISMTTKIAESLSIDKGDTIEWRIYGSEDWKKCEIGELYRDPSTQGIMMTRETLEQNGLDFKPTAVISTQTIEGEYEGIVGIVSISEIIAGWDELTEAMMIMVYILIVGAAVLSIVVLYNLGVLSFTEKERDMATLKVMGLKTNKLRVLLLTQNIWFSVIGFIIGLPIGLALIEMMVEASGDSFDFPVELTFNNFILSFLITFGLSLLTSLLFSNRIKKINMVESLKSQE